jgi:hypothetical protein
VRGPGGLLLALLVTGPAPAEAQVFGSSGGRAAMVDSVIGVQDYFADDGAWETQLVVDSFMSVELAPRLQASLRPLLWRKADGATMSFIDHASLRYEFRKGANWRIEGGKFPSPIGLGMTENRASVNDSLLWCHRPYYGSVPSVGVDSPPHAMVSATYPVGVLVSASGDHWDARAAVVDRAPTDLWYQEDVPRRANGVVGAGLSPRQGLRFGVSGAWGRSGDAAGSEPYTLLNVEGEYAFAYTKISGEWTRDVFETQAGDVAVSGWTLQGKQTLTPRVFVHSRFSTVESPEAIAYADYTDRRFWTADSTVGYLIDPEITLRIGHAALRGWGGPDVDHQFGVSLIWSKRWW